MIQKPGGIELDQKLELVSMHKNSKFDLQKAVFLKYLKMYPQAGM